MLHRKVGDLVKGHTVISLPPRATVREAARCMRSGHVASVLVTDTGSAIAGIFTERDLTDRVVADGRDPDATSLAQVMSPSPATIPADATVADAVRLMFAHTVRHLPVTGRDGVVIGVVSLRDFMGLETADLDRARALTDGVAEVL